jgi:hypothetical protein
LSFIFGRNNLPKHSSSVHFLSYLPQIGAFHPLTYEQEIFVPQQESFRDVLAMVHAERAGIVVRVRRIALRALQFLSG